MKEYDAKYCCPETALTWLCAKFLNFITKIFFGSASFGSDLDTPSITKDVGFLSLFSGTSTLVF